MSGRVHEVSHLHKTRPNYLHIRAFHIYSEQTRSRQIFEHSSVPFSPVQTQNKLSYRPRLQTSPEPALHTAYSEKPRSWTKRNFSYTFTIWWNVWWQDRGLFLKSFVLTFRAQISAYACLVNETHCFISKLSCGKNLVCTSFFSCQAASKIVYHEHVLSCWNSYESSS